MPKTYLQLGRYGDLINIFPVLYDDFLESGEKPRVIVSKDFSDVFEGISYAEPIVYDGNYADISGALKFAKEAGIVATPTQVVGIPEVLVSQVYNNPNLAKVVCDSFQKDAWRLAGKLDMWPKQPKLVIDKRNKRREAKLLKGIPTDKPWLVVSTGGFSAPFPFRELFNLIFKGCLPEFRVIDLGDIKAEKFCDLLAIMDHANTHALVLNDSGPLHLAYATEKPVHAIVANTPLMWHGPAWRPFYASYTRYNNFARDVPRIVELIRTPALPAKNPNVIHLYQRMPWATGDTKRRNDLAAKTWEGIGWVDCGLDDNCFVKTAVEIVPKETKRLPLIKEMIRMACIGRDDKDLIVLTNTDTCVASNILERLVGVLPAFAYRNDFMQKLSRPVPDDHILVGKKYPGCDLFVFRVGWWRKNHALYPDMILGRHSWDRIFRELVKMAKGREISNCIYHEWHDSDWERNLNDDLCNLRNAKLAREWLLARKMPLEELEQMNYEGKQEKKTARKK